MGRQKKRQRKFAHKPHKLEKPTKKARIEKDQDADVADTVEDQKQESEAAAHVRDLKNLAETQSEFFEFLAKEDAELLNFDEDDDEPEDDSEATDTSQPPILTFEIYSTWQKGAGKSLKAINQLVKAFTAAVLINDPEKSAKLKFKYRLTDSALFNEILVFSIKEMGDIFTQYLGDSKVDKDTKALISSRYPTTWPKLVKFVRSYLSALLQLLQSLSEENMLLFLLKQTEKIVSFFGPFPKHSRAFLKKLLSLWSTGQEAVRIVAFFNIRATALELPYPFINHCLKGSYLNFVKNTKFFNHNTEAMVNFMANCVVELYGIDTTASYQHAFVYIRQLSVHLRATMASIHPSAAITPIDKKGNKSNNNNKDKKQSKDDSEGKRSQKKKQNKDHESVYNWQVLNSISLWIKVLSAYPERDQLWLLCHPLVQLLQGIISLVPTQRYYPLRCHCVKLLNILAHAKAAKTPSTNNNTNNNNTNGPTEAPSLFINSAGYLIEMLDYFTSYLSKKDTKFKLYNGKSPRIHLYILKSPDKLLGTKPFLDGMLCWTHDLLGEYLNTYARSIAFPELVLPISVHLKKFVKAATNRSKFKSVVCAPFVVNKYKSLVTAIQQQSAVVTAARSLISNFGPSNTSQVQSFLSPSSKKNQAELPIEKYYRTTKALQDSHEPEEDTPKKAAPEEDDDEPNTEEEEQEQEQEQEEGMEDYDGASGSESDEVTDLNLDELM